MTHRSRTRAALVATLGVLALGALAAGTAAFAAPEESGGDDPAGPAPAGGATAPAAQSAEDAYAGLQKEFDEANAAFRQKVMDLRKEHGNDWQKFAGDPPPKTFLPRFQEGAKTYAGQEGAAPFLIMVMQLGMQLDTAAAKSALTTLAKQHASHPRMQELAFALWRGDRQLGSDLIDPTIDTILANTKNDQVKAAMLFARGSRANSPKATDEVRAKALDDLRKASELGKGTRFGDMAGGTIFELEHLQIGMTAPDIEGADFDGKTFKLSDYRGKVVVLDFWGDW